MPANTAVSAEIRPYWNSPMQENLFDHLTRLNCRAVFLGERIDVRGMSDITSLATWPLVIRAGREGCAVIFRYGVVVLFNLTAEEESSSIQFLRQYAIDAFADAEFEQITITVDTQQPEGIASNKISVAAFNLAYVQIIATVLAKSVVMAHYETMLSAVFDKVEPLAASLQKRGSAGRYGRELLRYIGGSLLIQHKMVSRVEVEEKPDILWEQPQFERLYLRLEDEYELKERHRVLLHKLELISATASTALDLIQNKSSLRVEWYIVILIVAEIVLTLYEMFFHTS